MSNGSKKASRSMLRGIGIFLLVLLLTAGGFLGLLYYTLTTDTVTVDDPAALAAQAPMPASRRFAFDSAKETAQLCLDKSDLWWLLLPELEENLLENVNRDWKTSGEKHPSRRFWLWYHKTRKESVIITITDSFLAGAQGLEP